MEYTSIAPMANEEESHHLGSHHILAPSRLQSLMDINSAHMAINHSSLMDTRRHHGALMAPGEEHQTVPLLDDPDSRCGHQRKRRARDEKLQLATEGQHEATLDVVTLEYTGPLNIQQSRTTAGDQNQRLRTKAKPIHHWLSEMPKKSRGDAALDRARLRNVRRLRAANDQDNNILSKYLPSDVRAFFPVGVEGPDDFRVPSDSWVSEIIAVAETSCPAPRKPFVLFDCSSQSLERNTRYLESCGWDMCEVFRQHVGTTVDHGSEFRPIDQLSRLVGRHPNYPFLKEMFQSGFEYFLSRELSEEERTTELEAQLERGNHKSATENEDEINSLLTGDVVHGFVLPFLASSIKRLKGVHLQPGGMVRQMSLKADGSRKMKNRFTHDLSFSITMEDASVNSRIQIERYPDMVYGFCLWRILHYLAALRYRNPRRKIFISKFDYSDAYKRISQSPRTSASTVIRFGEVAYICWRMVFGGSPNPAGFSCFSEMLTDLANELAMSDYTPALGKSPTVEDFHATVRETEVPEAPIGQAYLPALEVSTTSDSFRDCFIDDIIDCHLDTPRNRCRAAHIVQMAVHVMSRPHAGDDKEPVPRRPLLGPDKLSAEGRSSERQVVLGWEIRTREFTVALPRDKHHAWKEDLASIIASGKASREETESLIGRLNHASYVIPLSRHFLNEIRRKCLNVPRRATVRFTKEEIADLRLWEKFLDSAHKGLSINLLVVRTPTRIAWSDSCPFGLGGYTLSGTAWRIKVPRDCPFYGDDTVNNVLEFLGMAVSVLLLIKEAQADNEGHPCLLVLGDNTSAISWIFKSGRISRVSKYYKAVKMIARHIARSTLSAAVQVCSQHLAGTTNTVADLLSFEGSCRSKEEPLTKDCPPNDILTQRIHTYHSQIIPSGFEIRPLPHEIESFALSVMRIAAKSWTRKEKQPMSEATDIYADGKPSLSIGVWDPTPGSIRYPMTRNDCSWQGDLSCDTGPSTSTHRVVLLRSVRDPWYRRLFEMPLAAWHRRSGNVDGPAPSTSRTESMIQDRCTPESGPSSKGLSETTHHQTDRRQ